MKTEFAPAYFNSTMKTVINSKYMFDKSFQEILHRINNWINEGPGWVIESIDAEHVNIFVFSPLSGRTYTELTRGLRNSMKGLINIKNNKNKRFLWCHIRHLNTLKIHPKRITKADKNMVNDHYYEDIKFPVSKTDFGKFEKKNNICIVFCYDNNLVYPVSISDEKIENCMNLLVIRDENKSHYAYNEDFNRFIFNNTKCKTKKHFCKYCLYSFSGDKALIKF